jgi:hypothetical protein
MCTCGKWRQAPCILIFGTRWSWAVSITRRLPHLRGHGPSIYCVRGWVGPRLGLGVVVTRETPESIISRPARAKLVTCWHLSHEAVLCTTICIKKKRERWRWGKRSGTKFLTDTEQVQISEGRDQSLWFGFERFLVRLWPQRLEKFDHFHKFPQYLYANSGILY